jgi:hypothetical protein
LYSKSFKFTGHYQSLIIPVTNNGLIVRVTAIGAGSQNCSNTQVGGKGGKVVAIFYPPISWSNATLYVYVGGQGTYWAYNCVAYNGKYLVPTFGSGWNGGGYIYPGCLAAAGGGGATDIRIGGRSLSNRIIVAGGGGACSSINPTYSQQAGNGGYPAGTASVNNYIPNNVCCGLGGTQTAGGAGGSGNCQNKQLGQNGRFGYGGNSTGLSNSYSGAGGGGFYGGGSGGNCWAGGGGSSYVSKTLSLITNASYTTGGNQGNGSLIIDFLVTTPSSQPTSQPSKQPSSRPSGQPSSQPTRQPTSQPTNQPSRQPT